jgi:hypothetical protein
MTTFLRADILIWWTTVGSRQRARPWRRWTAASGGERQRTTEEDKGDGGGGGNRRKAGAGHWQRREAQDGWLLMTAVWRCEVEEKRWPPM